MSSRVSDSLLLPVSWGLTKATSQPSQGSDSTLTRRGTWQWGQERGKVTVLLVGTWGDRAAASLSPPGGEPKHFEKVSAMPETPLASYLPYSLAPVSCYNPVQPRRCLGGGYPAPHRKWLGSLLQAHIAQLALLPSLPPHGPSLELALLASPLQPAV